jgi:hypothetical protein
VRVQAWEKIERSAAANPSGCVPKPPWPPGRSTGSVCSSAATRHLVGEEECGVLLQACHHLHHLERRRLLWFCLCRFPGARLAAVCAHRLGEPVHRWSDTLGLVGVADRLDEVPPARPVGEEFEDRGLMGDEDPDLLGVSGDQLQTDLAAAAVAEDVRGRIAGDGGEQARGIVGVGLDVLGARRLV